MRLRNCRTVELILQRRIIRVHPEIRAIRDSDRKMVGFRQRHEFFGMEQVSRRKFIWWNHWRNDANNRPCYSC